jgi:hypothetical protein
VNADSLDRAESHEDVSAKLSSDSSDSKASSKASVILNVDSRLDVEPPEQRVRHESASSSSSSSSSSSTSGQEDVGQLPEEGTLSTEELPVQVPIRLISSSDAA